MGRKTHYTNITPLPPGIPRQLAIDMLHSHGEIIELNPLVLDHHPIKAPKDAAADEYFAVWHEITERIQYIPGMGKMASGKISFKGVFHDMPWGLQTHIYAPAGVDLRNKWQIKGNQPGEPREPRELGDKAPPDGLYLQEDIEIVCNMTLTPFVKKSLKAASAVLVARLLKKAELLDAGQLQAMVENGRLKTINPAVAHQFAAPVEPQLPSQVALGPGQIPYSPMSPQVLSPLQSFRNTYYNTNTNPNPNDQNAAASAYARQSSYAQPHQNAIEMPGSYYYPQPPQNPAYLQSQNNRYSTMSELSATSPRQASFSDSTSPPLGSGASPHIGGQSPRTGGGGGSVHGGSEYSSTTATSELPSQPGGYLRPMGSPGLVPDRDRYSVMSEMPTSRE
jgi:hypothetical protein